MAVGKMQPTTELQVPPGESAEKWLVFGGLPPGNQVPSLVLRIAAAGTAQEIDLNEAARRQMKLTVERIGPRGCLALLTVGGELNTVNIGSLVGTLESLVAQKVVRAVIRFDRSVPQLDGQILSWLQQGAFLAGRGENNNMQLPLFPAALRELHFARLPNHSAENLQGAAGDEPRIHQRDAVAVRAALKSAIESLPRAELLAEIEKGHPLVRPVALADGGSRLTSEDLPLVLRFADGNDVKMQLAAITAVRHFGEPAAIDKLLFYARRNVEPTVSAAIESLAASRYAVAHQALLDVLKKEHPASRRIIVRAGQVSAAALVRHDLFVHQRSRSQRGRRSPACPGGNGPSAAVGFAQGRPRPRHAAGPGGSLSAVIEAERSAERRAGSRICGLHAMKSGTPNTNVYELLTRTKDPRAIPLLLHELDRVTGNRSQIINVLAQIGDQSAAEALAAKYPTLSDRDKASTLNALQTLKSPHFRRFAGEALMRGDTSLVSTAIIGLQNDGGPQAVQLLVNALESSKNLTIWSYITNALANFGTTEAKVALQRARDSDNPRKRELALEACGK